jgi:hypothetical protein
MPKAFLQKNEKGYFLLTVDLCLKSNIRKLNRIPELLRNAGLRSGQAYKSATFRQAQGKLRRNCSRANRTLNGASQQAMRVAMSLAT